MKKIYLILFIILASILVFGYIKSNNDNTASQADFPQTYANAVQEVKTSTPVELEVTNDPEKLSQYGNELLHAGNYEQSIKYFDKSLSIKYNETVLNRKANALLKLQNNEGAMECADAVLQNNSTNAVALDIKGICLVNLDKFDQSIEYFDRSLSIRYNEKVLNRKADALFHLYNYEGVIECADAVLKNNSTNTYALGMKAISFTKLGDFNQGIKYIDMAIQINPEDQMLIKTKNAINAEQEKKEEETPIETSTYAEESTTPDSSLTTDDIMWINTTNSDTTTIATTLNDLTLASQDTQEGIGSTNSLSLYAGDLDRETKIALSNSNKYTVSSELIEAQSEYNEAMTDYNKAAKLIIKAMDAYNQGDTDTYSSQIGQSTKYLNSGIEHFNTATYLLNDYK